METKYGTVRNPPDSVAEICPIIISTSSLPTKYSIASFIQSVSHLFFCTLMGTLHVFTPVVPAKETTESFAPLRVSVAFLNTEKPSLGWFHGVVCSIVAAALG